MHPCMEICQKCFIFFIAVGCLGGILFTAVGGVAYTFENGEIQAGKGSESMCTIKAMTSTSGKCFVNENCNGTGMTFNVWFDTNSGCDIQDQEIPYGLNINPYECQLERVIPCWSISSTDFDCGTKFVVWQRTGHDNSTKFILGVGLAF